jgi:hypothetical protein
MPKPRATASTQDHAPADPHPAHGQGRSHEQETLLDVYKRALGMLPDEPAAAAAD